MGFHYEKELPHQMAAIDAVLAVFNGANKNENGAGENPRLSFSGSLYREISNPSNRKTALIKQRIYPIF
ncbi:hypothetical protein [Rodentibacter heidelbergensis]|uniref:hypothetical protein n=1 Tax=Rodentibacter heidelbergensis TaxID=1908258 RepID=UPI001FC91758|nr:hypothetical protein [Rodentibacter heidelbergensis]